MRIFLCDRCGKICTQVIHIDVRLKYVEYAVAWSDKGVEGDYCQECLDYIARAIHTKSKEEQDDDGRVNM